MIPPQSDKQEHGNLVEDLSVELDFSPMFAYEKRVGEFAAKLYNPDHKLVVADFKWASEEACYALDQCIGGPDDNFPLGRSNFDWIPPFIELVKSLATKSYVYGGEDYRIVDEGMERLVGLVQRIVSVFKLFIPDKFENASCWWDEEMALDGKGMRRVFDGSWLCYFLDEFRLWAIKLSEEKLRLIDEKMAASRKAEPKPLFVVSGGAPREPKQRTAAPKDAAKDAEWNRHLDVIEEDARNPWVRAEVCVKWEEVKRKIEARQPAEMKRENFGDILNFVNKYRNHGDPIEWTWGAAEKWAKRHPDMIRKFKENPNL